MLVVLVTVPTRRLAGAVARAAVREHAAACVTVLGPAASLFWWNQHVDQAKEFVLICKTTRQAWPRLRRLVRRLHSYSVPELIALPVVAGDKPYLQWVHSATGAASAQ